MFKKLFTVVSLLIAFSMVLAACAPATTVVTQVVQQTSVVKETQVVQQTSVVKETQIVEVTPTPQPTTRHGGWLDQLVYTIVGSDSAITQLKAGAVDAYAVALPSSQLPAIQDAGLSSVPVLGLNFSIMYNSAACKDTAVLNPFADSKIREATNMLYDRNYINQEIYAGGSLPKFFQLLTNGPDYADLADVVRGLEAKYAYNLDAAKTAIATEMQGLGATLGSDGKWQFSGKPVTLIFLIRPDGDGTRKPLGDYVASQLEAVGFTVDRQYKKSSEAGPIWQKTSTECQWMLYTAGWGSPGLQRDMKGEFQDMYLNSSPQGIQPFLSHVADPAFQKLGDDLANGNFTTAQQRHDMMAQALTLSMQDSLQVFIVDTRSFAPFTSNVQVSGDLAGGIEASPIAFYTLRFKGMEGGSLKWGESDLFTEPYNPIIGSNWMWDQGIMAAIDSEPFMHDPYTGLLWPLRAESADITVQAGLPITKTLDWVTLNTADTIPVPSDAWVDWNAKTQKFITAGEAFTQTVNAKVKAVINFPANMFDTVTWHDGSKLSVGDFVMAMIEAFDRAKTDSAIYDEAAVPNFQSFMAGFKGVKIDSTSPLVIEYYTDNYYSDAELDAWLVNFIWPQYGFGESPWDAIAIGNMAEAAGEAAYSGDKATAKNVDQTSFVGGPTLDILSKYLDQAIANNTVPYSPTLGTYITADEATTRYANLKTWYAAHGNYQLGLGPYYLDRAYLVEKSAVLKSYTAYPDLANRWDGFTEPKVPVVDITGPAGQVKIGDTATFNIAVSFNQQPYPQSEMKQVKYLLYDATGAVVKTGLATAVSDGQYQVILTADDTKLLTAGSNKFEVAAVSNLVAVPTFSSIQFVTAP